MYGELSKLRTKTTIGASVRLKRTHDARAPFSNEVGRYTVYCSAPRCRTEFGQATICRAADGWLFIDTFRHPPDFIDRHIGEPSTIEPLPARSASNPARTTRTAAGWSPADRLYHLKQFSPEMREELLANPWLGQVKAPDGRPLTRDYSVPGIELPKLLRCPLSTCGATSEITWEVVPLIRTSTAA